MPKTPKRVQKAQAAAAAASTEGQLYVAIERKDLDQVNQLLKLGVSTAPVPFNSPILKCLDNYHRGIFSKLLTKGVDPNFKDRTHPLPLMKAIEKGNMDAVHLLVMNGAIIDNIDTIATPSGGQIIVSPLTYAIRLNNLDMVDFLLRQLGADLNFNGRVPPSEPIRYATFNRGDGIERVFDERYEFGDSNYESNESNESNKPVESAESKRLKALPPLPGFKPALETAFEMKNAAMIEYVTSFKDRERRTRIAESRRAELGLAPMGLPKNVMSRISGMFLKEGNIATAPVPGGPGATGGGMAVATPGATGGGSAAAGTKTRRRFTRRKLRR